MRTSTSFFIVFTPLSSGIFIFISTKALFFEKVLVGVKIRICWLVGFLKIEYRKIKIKAKSKVIQLLEF
jgi:hypothetical protein